MDKTPEINKSLPAEKVQRRRYFSEFALAHASAFKPHWKEGDTLGRAPDKLRNVSEHCLVEGVLADVLAEELHLPEKERNDVVAAALMHDWFKKHETRAAREAVQAGEQPLLAYEKSRTTDAEVLKGMGVKAEVLQIMDAIVPSDRKGPQTIPEKIMWYVDATTSNTEPVRVRERFDNLERGWDGVKEDPARAARNKAFSEQFKPRYGGASLYDVQRELAEKIEPELATLVGYQGPSESFPDYLRSKVEERIRESAVEQEAVTTGFAAARAASDLVLKYWPNPSNAHFDEKLSSEIIEKSQGVGNYATVADGESEKLIIDTIRNNPLLAGHSISGEELGDAKKTSQWEWVIDPIDGTQPFRNGLPEFGISIGILKEGKPHIGIVAMPALGQMIAARKGAGAHLYSLDGTKLADLKDLSLKDQDIRRLLVGFDTGYEGRSGQIAEYVSGISDKIGYPVSYGSSSYANFRVALGMLGGYFHKVPTKFDIAGAAAILEEVGGVVTTIDGSPIDWKADQTSYLAARTPEVHAALVKALNKPQE